MVFMSSCVSLVIDGFIEYIKKKINEYYSLESADDIISAGLHLTDLNLFDSTSELLITSMHQTREIEEAIEKVSSTDTISMV